MVIINTPQEINHVFIDIPEELWDAFGSRFLMVNEFNTKKWSERQKLGFRDILARGIDLHGKNFIASVNIRNHEIDADITKLKFAVNCHENVIIKDLKLFFNPSISAKLHTLTR